MYLINCMPTIILQNQSMFKCLFHRTPYHDFLRTFGCIFFPFCVYIMLISWIFVHIYVCFYHLGYHCLDLASQRVYISNHVCFHEDLFPFIKSE